MSDKARGALFNILGDLAGMTVLDPFAGTGALSFEAISRGAAHATAIEVDRPAQRIIHQNIASLGLGAQVDLIQASANAWLQTNYDETFDLVLCDPPHNDLQPNLLIRLSQRVAANGLLVLSWPTGGSDLPSFPKLDHLDTRNYGDLQLVFYRKIS